MTPVREHVRSVSRVARAFGARTANPSPIQLAALFVAAVSIALYALTAGRSFSFHDPAEMQTVPHVLGIAHPPGYPLYTLVGRIWSEIPVGSVAFRANLLSGLSVSIALAVATLAMGRLKVPPTVAAGSALTLGFSPVAWQATTLASVRTFHLLLIGVLLYALLAWAQDRRPRQLYLLAFVTGLALAHHPITITIAPIVAIAALWTGRRVLEQRPRLLLPAGVLGLAGLAPYLYLPARAAQHPPVMYRDTSTWDAFVAHVSASEFGSSGRFLGWQAAGRFVEVAPQWIADVAADATPVFLVGALIGLAHVARRSPAMALTGAALVAVNVHVVANQIGLWRFEEHLLTAWFVAALAAAVGAAAVLARIGADPRLQTIAAAILPLLLIVSVYPAVDMSGNRDGEEFVAELYRNLPPNAAVSTHWDTWTALQYSQHVDRARPDVLAVAHVEDLPQHVGRRPVYVIHAFDRFTDPFWERFRVTEVARIKVPYSADLKRIYDRPLLRIDP